MEPRFQVETRHGEEAYRDMAAVHFMRHKKNPHSTMMLYVLGVVLAAVVWFAAAEGDYTSVSALGAGIFTLAAAWLLTPYIDRFSAQRVCQRLADTTIRAAKKAHTFGIPTRYRFYEDHMDAADGAGCIETPYSKVTDLVETQHYFLLFDNDGKCVLARKSDFTLGDPKDFSPFLSSVCGRAMEPFQPAPARRR